MITTLSFDGFSISKAVSFGPRMISHYKVVSYNSSISIIFYREVPVTVCENGHRLVGLTVHTLIHLQEWAGTGGPWWLSCYGKAPLLLSRSSTSSTTPQKWEVPVVDKDCPLLLFRRSSLNRWCLKMRGGTQDQWSCHCWSTTAYSSSQSQACLFRS